MWRGVQGRVRRGAVGLRCVGPSDEGGGWERHAHLTIATDDTRAGKLLVPLTLEVQLPRLRVEPRELLVAMREREREG